MSTQNKNPKLRVSLDYEQIEFLCTLLVAEQDRIIEDFVENDQVFQEGTIRKDLKLCKDLFKQFTGVVQRQVKKKSD